MRQIMDLYRGEKVLLGDEVMPASIAVADGKIARVFPRELVRNTGEYRRVVDAPDDWVIMPGVVDSHVHVNEPGRTEWEGFATATRAAAAGGVTTIVDMPLNSIPPTTSLARLDEKVEVARGKCHVDVAFWGGVVPGNADEIRPMVERGVAGFKCFLVHSGVDEFPSVTKEEVMEALEQLKGTDSVLLFHAELEVDKGEHESKTGRDPTLYSTFLASRHAGMENEAVQMVIEASETSGVRCHVVHLASGDAVADLASAQRRGVPVTAETCHHYLTLAAEEVPDGATQFKCCPPVREARHREALWDALARGVVSMVVSDHSPCTPDLKRLDIGDFLAAWGGISSVQFGLSLFWTNAVKRGNAFGIADTSRLLSRAPAELAGLGRRKGRIAVGYDADLVLWNPDEEFEVSPECVEHKNKVTPYMEMVLRGKVKMTVVGGLVAYEEGAPQPEKPVGKILLAGRPV